MTTNSEVIVTRKRLRAAIRECKSVWACIRFGNSEKYYQISKKTALDLTEGIPEHVDDTEMDNFAILENDELSLW